MSIKMKDVFNLPINVSLLGIDSELVSENFDDGVLPHECAAIAINNHDALVEALEWALERAEPEVRETDRSMDQMMLIKYQTLLQEFK